MSIEETLNERQERYGDFIDYATIATNLKNPMRSEHTNYSNLSDDKKEALEMIMGKIARILSGDPEYRDSWHDIAGYATLIDDSLADDEWVHTEPKKDPPLTDDIVPDRREQTERPLWNFRATTFSRVNTVEAQLRHMVSEAQEFIDAHREWAMTANRFDDMIDEATDFLVSFHTLINIKGCESLARESQVRVEHKNDCRGYYDE